jgi:hypothetical protein
MSKLTKVAFKLLDLFVIFMMTFGSPMAAYAQVWGTTRCLVTDDGTPFIGGEAVDVQVTGPYGLLYACDNFAWNAELTEWTCTVQLSSDPAIAVGEYSFTATGLESGNVETGTFTDGKQILRAWRNQPGPTLNTWDAGTTIQNSNSVYAEGESIPFVWTIEAGNPAPQLQEGVTYTIQLDYAFRGGTTSPEKFFFDYPHFLQCDRTGNFSFHCCQGWWNWIHRGI